MAGMVNEFHYLQTAWVPGVREGYAGTHESSLRTLELRRFKKRVDWLVGWLQ